MTKLNPTEFYNRVGRQHFGANYGYFPAEQDKTFNAITNLNPNGKIVELACGDARVMKGLLKAGFDVHGYDASQTMLDIAIESGVPRARLSLLDIYETSLPSADGSVDVAFCSRALSYLHSPMQAVHEMLRVTKPGKHVFIDFFHAQKAVSPKEVGDTHGFDTSGEELHMRTYAFSAQKIVSEARNSFNISRIDVLHNNNGESLQNVKRHQLKQMPDGYVYLQLHKAL